MYLTRFSSYLTRNRKVKKINKKAYFQLQDYVKNGIPAVTNQIDQNSTLNTDQNADDVKKNWTRKKKNPNNQQFFPKKPL